MLPCLEIATLLTACGVATLPLTHGCRHAVTQPLTMLDRHLLLAVVVLMTSLHYNLHLYVAITLGCRHAVTQSTMIVTKSLKVGCCYMSLCCLAHVCRHAHGYCASVFNVATLPHTLGHIQPMTLLHCYSHIDVAMLLLDLWCHCMVRYTCISSHCHWVCEVPTLLP